MTTEKTCYVCGRAKPLDGFCRNRCKRDGRSDECRECKRRINGKYTGPLISTVRPCDENREPYVVDPKRIKAIRRLLATPCKVYWLPSTRHRCPHGRWEEDCAECERQQRAEMRRCPHGRWKDDLLFALAVEEDES